MYAVTSIYFMQCTTKAQTCMHLLMGNIKNKAKDCDTTILNTVNLCTLAYSSNVLYGCIYITCIRLDQAKNTGGGGGGGGGGGKFTRKQGFMQVTFNICTFTQQLCAGLSFQQQY